MTEPTAIEVSVGNDLPGLNPAILIMTLGRQLRTEVERDLVASGLTLRHLSALGHLGREPGLSYSELARRAGVTAQSMQATLQQLEALGAVERRTPPGRGRTAELHLTDTGRRLRTAGLETIDAANRQLLAALPEQDVTTLGTLLMRLLHANRPVPRP
jgi:DNA-binding MarR family transcriptional regulator